MSKLKAKIASGKNKGVELVPKKHQDDKYVASTSRFEVDYIRLDTVDELRMLVETGLSARMYSPVLKTAPSLIKSENIAIEEVSDEVHLSEYVKHIFAEGNLDYKSVTNSRKEQSLLRSLLVGGLKTSKCVMCGETLPVELLVAAHIKQRAKCDEKERLDFENVVALMCKLGCDELYEKGYICVVDGKIVINSKRKTTDFLKSKLSKLQGNPVNDWGKSKKYYEWHAKHFLGKNNTNV